MRRLTLDEQRNSLDEDLPERIEIERAQVPTRQAIRTKLFRPRTSLRGLLLWTNLEPIPIAFAHGDVLPATVVFCSPFEDYYGFAVSLRVDRRHQ